MGRRLRSGVLPRCFGRHSCRLGVRAHRQRRFTRSLLLSGRFRDCQRRPNVLLVHLFPHTCDPLPVPTRYGDTIAPAAVDARILRRRVTLLATACLVQHYISESTAQRPGPDFPRLLWEFDRELGRVAYRWLGRPDPDTPQRYPRRRSELSQRDLDLAEIVHAIPNNCSWEEWNRIGMAIFTASDGSGDGFVAFDDFSAKSATKYNPRTVAERWRNYRRSPPSRIGMGSLVHLARQAGWTSNNRATS